MRLHRLVLQGIGPFKDRQEVDFDRLSESSLFLIDGKTGSGKSTIIDCITYALFNTMAGSSAVSDSDRMRSDACLADDDSFVELTFSVDARTYVVTRSPEYQVPKQRGEGTTKKAAAASVIITNADGEQVPAPTKSNDIVARIETDLGMTADQFRRLVVLPQGEFAQLLTANSSDRQRDLEPLISDPLYRSIQAELKNRADAAQARRASADDAVRVAATKVIGDLEGLESADREGIDETLFLDERAEDATRIAAMHAGIEHVHTLRAEANRIAQEQSTLAARDRQTAKTAQEVVQIAESLIEARAGVVDAEQSVSPEDRALNTAELTAQIEAIGTSRGRLEVLVRWEAAAAEREAAQKLLDDERSGCAAEATALNLLEADAPKARTGLEAQLVLAQEAAAQLPLLQQHTEQAAAWLTAATARDAAATTCATAKTALGNAQDAEIKEQQEVRDALTQANDLRRQQRDQMAALLASQLAAGEACPVCGATDHPAVASLPDQTLISDDVIAEADALVTVRDQLLSKAKKAVASAGADVTAADVKHAKALGELGEHADLSVTEFRTRAEDAAQALSDGQLLASTLDALGTRLAALAAEAEARRTRLAEIDSELAANRSKVQAAAAEASRMLADIAAVVGAGSRATDADAHLRDRHRVLDVLRAARIRLHELAAGNSAAADADLPAARAQADQLDVVATESERLAKELADRAATLSSRHDSLSAHVQEFGDQLEASADVRAQTATDIRLGALATGKTGNIRSTDLATYALQRKFSAVLAAASERLLRMTGRYEFELNADKSRGLAGLGIAVFDSRHGSARDPKTLSGGEKFQASLALALGLAEVVQAEVGAAKLEMLFVDEGFGSLDADTLSVVIEQLEKLQDTGRIVGVISHVAEMKSAITDKIEVISNGDGTSRIEWPGA
jgi:exonuclease SbcC